MDTGGAEKVMLQLVALQKKNDISNLVCSSGGKYVENLRRMGIKHITIGDIASKKPTDMIRILIQLCKIIKTEHVDVVHTHHRMAAMYVRILNMLHVIQVCQINTQHNIFYDKKWLTHFALSKSINIAVGKGVKRNLIEFFNVREKSIVTIFNSIKPPKTFKPKNKVINGHMSVISIGRLTEQKGMTYLIQAAEIVKKRFGSQVDFKIIGDGELKDELLQEIKKRNVSDICSLSGYSDHVFSDISNANVVVLSSLWEGLPLIPIESFACGRPVIASKIEGNMELISNGYNGYLFEVQSPLELAKRIFCLKEDADLLQRLSDNALESYKRFYSYELFCQKYLSIYRSL